MDKLEQLLNERESYLREVAKNTAYLIAIGRELRKLQDEVISSSPKVLTGYPLTLFGIPLSMQIDQYLIDAYNDSRNELENIAETKKHLFLQSMQSVLNEDKHLVVDNSQSSIDAICRGCAADIPS